MVVPRGRRSRGYLLHLTNIDNLPAIFEASCLYAPSRLPDNVIVQELGSPTIKAQRSERSVPCGAGGMVSDYVPFYFSAQSPMLYFAYTGNPLSPFSKGQRDLVHVMTHIEKISELGRQYAFSDRNAAIGYAEFSSDLTQLDDYLDWTLQDQQYWNNTPEYPDRMERRMAEFLVYDNLPVQAILAIGVIDDALKARVESLLAEYDCPNVVVTSSWYY